ncbi:hypothetical protein N6L26_09315 [Qipengyuania sp. SS22]|uniref:hypothetical protein n=1 Tax=Qipengyuania sp. SS22 TaxID=2979461 RepID=UPI0021E5AF43|nr:hypothetical protein [Qipengyuania sp. SS22]UYH54252.1 hypothetical protein N6L26_09315 [Qipengyuania sp. SS22]
MSERDWSRYTAVGLSAFGLVAALIIFAAFTFNLGSLLGFKEAETQRYTTEYADRTDERIADCDRFVSAARIRECAEKAIKANHENQRDERDLQAQRQMAEWAFWLLVVTTFGTLITIGGTVLIWKQVALTREAVKDTGDATKAMVRQNDIAESAQRPWIKASCTNVQFQKLDKAASAFYEIVLENVGHMVAHQVAYSLRCFITRTSERDDVRDWFREAEPSDRVETFSMIPGDTASFSGKNLQALILPNRPPPEPLIFFIRIGVVVRYKIDPEGAWHYSEYSFALKRNDADPFVEQMFPDSMESRVYAPEEISVRRFITGRVT